MYQLQKKESAFTLVEMAIVLVIVGLLIGGVLQGQELIKIGKRQAQLKFFSDIDFAMDTFKLKFNAMPGDMRNITSYYPNRLDLANGDGNGSIYFTWLQSRTFTGEEKQFFNHLNAAGFLTNISPTLSGKEMGVDFPLNPIDNGTGTVITYPYVSYSERYYYRMPNHASYPNIWTGDDGPTLEGNVHYLWLNVTEKSISSHLTAASGVKWKVEDVYWLESKLDDTKMSTGKIIAPHQYNSTTLNDNRNNGCRGTFISWSTNHSYSLTGTECFIIYKLRY